MEARIAIIQAATVVVAIFVWEYLVNSGILPNLFFASPTQIAHTLSAFAPNYLPQVVITLERYLFAFTLTIILGVGFGFAISQNETIYDLLNPVVGFGLVLPKATLIPLFILTLGSGDPPIIAFACFLGVFAVILNTIAAIRSTRPDYITLGKSLGYSKLGIYYRIILPASLPTLFTGLFLGSNLTMTGTLIMEIYRGLYGIGPLMNNLSSQFRTVELYDAIVLTIFITLAINFVFWYLSRRFSSWRLL